MVLSGISPDEQLVEFIELSDHPYFVGTQAHPELKSRPLEPHPLFVGFIAAADRYRRSAGIAAAQPDGRGLGHLDEPAAAPGGPLRASHVQERAPR